MLRLTPPPGAHLSCEVRISQIEIDRAVDPGQVLQQCLDDVERECFSKAARSCTTREEDADTNSIVLRCEMAVMPLGQYKELLSKAYNEGFLNGARTS